MCSLFKEVSLSSLMADRDDVSLSIKKQKIGYLVSLMKDIYYEEEEVLK